MYLGDNFLAGNAAIGTDSALSAGKPYALYRLPQRGKLRMLDAGRKLWSGESGQGLPEYALLVAAVVTLVVLVGQLFTREVNALIEVIKGYVDRKAGEL